MHYLIMCRSLTSAQRGAAILERKGISARVIRSPGELTGGGCGYALSLSGKYADAYRILRQNNIQTGKVYEKLGDGSYREVRE